MPNTPHNPLEAMIHSPIREVRFNLDCDRMVIEFANGWSQEFIAVIAANEALGVPTPQLMLGETKRWKP